MSNALIVGGVVWGLSVFTHERKPGGISRPLVVELVPLHGDEERKASPAGDRTVRQPVLLPPSPVAAPLIPGHAPKLSERSVSAQASLSGRSTGEDRQAAAPDAHFLSEYQRLLNALIARHSHYPAEARKLRLAGVTQLAFRLDRSGQVLGSWIEHSSGSATLDGAALDALDEAKPLPPIPAELPDKLDFVVEVDLAPVLASW